MRPHGTNTRGIRSIQETARKFHEMTGQKITDRAVQLIEMRALAKLKMALNREELCLEKRSRN